MSITTRTGKIVEARVINKDEANDLLAITVNGQIIRIPLKTVSTLGRVTQGVRIMKFKEKDDTVASIAILGKEDELIQTEALPMEE